MKLSYYLPRPDSLPISLAEITPLDPDQWEIQSAESACTGKYLLALTENVFPADWSAIAMMMAHLESSPDLAAVVAGAGPANRPPLPALIRTGATLFRKSVLDRIGGLSRLLRPAADYDLTFRILAAGSRIDHREDIQFQPSTTEVSDKAPGIEETACLLAVARKFLPENLAQIYWEDWCARYKALAAHAGQKKARLGAPLLAKWIALRQPLASQEPVPASVVESVLNLRRHAAVIGDWARRSSVWRVILADFSDNIWATYNACRSNGLQMRCIADNHPAFADMKYRDLPIAPANRAFEGGGIDGVILTTTDPIRIETNFKSLRNYFHGPILRLCQGPREATHAQATAA